MEEKIEPSFKEQSRLEKTKLDNIEVKKDKKWDAF